MSPSRPWPARLFQIFALLEAITWAGLLIGMALKYGPVGTEAGVRLFGRLHGGVFVGYVAVTLIAAWRLRWRWWVALLALAASIPPLVTVVLEVWLSLSGRLEHPEPRRRAERETRRAEADREAAAV